MKRLRRLNLSDDWLAYCLGLIRNNVIILIKAMRKFPEGHLSVIWLLSVLIWNVGAENRAGTRGNEVKMHLWLILYIKTEQITTTISLLLTSPSSRFTEEMTPAIGGRLPGRCHSYRLSINDIRSGLHRSLLRPFRQDETRWKCLYVRLCCYGLKIQMKKMTGSHKKVSKMWVGRGSFYELTIKFDYI